MESRRLQMSLNDLMESRRFHGTKMILIESVLLKRGLNNSKEVENTFKGPRRLQRSLNDFNGI